MMRRMRRNGFPDFPPQKFRAGDNGRPAEKFRKISGTNDYGERLRVGTKRRTAPWPICAPYRETTPSGLGPRSCKGDAPLFRGFPIVHEGRCD
jgi:hypothetical protein